MAEVRVLLDPGDDMQVSVGLLERHDPARGHVVVHPTPGARSLQAFAHDVLGALGQAVNRLDAEQLAGPAAAWRAVTAWMVTGQAGNWWCCAPTGSGRASASVPWEALSPQNDALRLTWHPPNRTLIRAAQVTARTPATTAVFYVPAAARPLLQAARHFSRSAPGHRPAGRLFAATPFSNERIAGAAANCKILLPSRRSLQGIWQTRVTCTRVDSFGTRFDASFADDQSFHPAPRSAA